MLKIGSRVMIYPPKSLYLIDVCPIYGTIVYANYNGFDWYVKFDNYYDYAAFNSNELTEV